MRLTLVLAAALQLSACAADEQWRREQNALVAARPDLASAATLRCDALFSRFGDSHRLCMMREIDRLGVTVAEGSAVRGAVPVLPFAYPPLAPSSSVVVVPAR